MFNYSWFKWIQLKVDLNNENLNYVINETVTLLQENSGKKVNSQESKLKTVSDLLLRAFNMSLSHKGSVSSK